MTPIRPNAFPVQSSPTSVAGQAADAARQAAQRAFFDAAMGRAGAPAAPSAPVAVAKAFTPIVQRIDVAAQASAQASGEAPAKLLRPGSLLDIRV